MKNRTHLQLVRKQPPPPPPTDPDESQVYRRPSRTGLPTWNEVMAVVPEVYGLAKYGHLSQAEIRFAFKHAIDRNRFQQSQR